MEEVGALFNSKSSTGCDPDLKYTRGVCHCFVQEQSKKFITLETQQRTNYKLLLVIYGNGCILKKHNFEAKLQFYLRLNSLLKISFSLTAF